MYQHKHHLLEGFTSKYDVTRLIWFVQGDDIASAISFEKKIKNRNRQWKIDLIEKTNPDWIDLAANWMDSVPTNTETGMPHAKAPVIPRGEHVTLRGRNPDVLSCIANLSNDEVFTPPEFANRMLDTLAEAWAASHDGANLWADKTVKFLDPCTKSGVFLREITRRLTQGLAEKASMISEKLCLPIIACAPLMATSVRQMYFRAWVSKVACVTSYGNATIRGDSIDARQSRLYIKRDDRIYFVRGRRE